MDRHLERDPDKVALIWEKDEPGQQEYITYRYIIMKQLKLSNNAPRDKINLMVGRIQGSW